MISMHQNRLVDQESHGFKIEDDVTAKAPDLIGER